MRLRPFVAAVGSALVVAALPAAGSPSSRQFGSPYACGYCLFELPLRGGPMRIVLGNPAVASVDDFDPVRRRVLLTRTDRTQGTGVYVLAFGGSGLRRLADGERGRWSPDRTRIAFRRSVRPGPVRCAGAALWVADADGSNARSVGECTRSVAWSPDSRRLAFFDVRGLNAEVGTLSVAAVDGTRMSVVADLQGPGEPAWAPAGDRIAFATFPDAEPPSGHGVFAGGPYELATQSVAIVGLDGSRRGLLPRSFSPVWSPTRAELAFQHTDAAVWNGYESADFRMSLRIASGDGTGVRPVRPRCCGLVRWLPAGDRLAFVDVGPSPRRGSVADQIFVVGRDGSRPRQVTRFLPGGKVREYWFTPDAARMFVLWEFTEVD